MTEFAAPLPILARYAVMVDVGYIYATAGELVFGCSSLPGFRGRAAPPDGTNQAERLVWESDTVDVLDGSFLRSYFTKNPVAAVEAARSDAALGSSPTVPSPAQLFGERHTRSTSRTGGHPILSNTGGFPAIRDTGPMPRLGPDRIRVEEAGEHVAQKWILTRGRDNIRDLLPGPGAWRRSALPG